MLTPTEEAEKLINDMYDHIYVNINNGTEIFKFTKPTIDMFKITFKDKCKELAVININEFLAFIAEVWGDDNDEYAYWEDVKTAVQNL